MNKESFLPNKIRLSFKRPERKERPLITSPSKAIKALRSVIEEDILDLKEQCWVLLLTADNHLLGISEINYGAIAGVSMYAREVFQLALISNAINIILVHNHPSGDLNPSDVDLQIIKKIKKIGKFMKIEIIDFVIITSEDHNTIKTY